MTQERRDLGPVADVMDAVAIAGVGEVVLRAQPIPAAKGDLVVVKILAAPMCGEFKQRRAGEKADALGHEAAGVVVDAGSSTRVTVGHRVVVMPRFACGVCELCIAGEHIYCPNQRDVLAETGQSFGTATYAQYVLKPDWLLVPVPEDISLLHASLACCGLGPSLTATQRTQVGPLDWVLISGCGPVGLGAVVHAKVRGARILAVETNPFRAELAKALGAELVIDPETSDVPLDVRAVTSRGVDAAIETSGAATAARALAKSLRVGGRMGVVSWGNDVDLPPLAPLGISVHGCWHWNHQRYAEEMWSTIRAAGSLLDVFITNVMPMSAVAEAMDLHDAGTCGKVVLLPNGEVGDEGLVMR
jgi:threonine dehydrogenase-like Zn-dependent dehydrogenase